MFEITRKAWAVLGFMFLHLEVFIRYHQRKCGLQDQGPLPTQFLYTENKEDRKIPGNSQGWCAPRPEAPRWIRRASVCGRAKRKPRVRGYLPLGLQGQKTCV